jgi:hypothetical protein
MEDETMQAMISRAMAEIVQHEAVASEDVCYTWRDGEWGESVRVADLFARSLAVAEAMVGRRNREAVRVALRACSILTSGNPNSATWQTLEWQALRDVAVAQHYARALALADPEPDYHWLPGTAGAQIIADLM